MDAGKGFRHVRATGEEQPFVGDWSGLTVVTRLNGAERQRSRADLMVFAIPRLIAFA